MSIIPRIAVKSFFFQKFIAPNILQCKEYRRSVAPFLKEVYARRKKLGYHEALPNHRNTYLEWNYSTELYAFSKRLGEEFEDSLLRRALTERSFIVKLEEDSKKVGIITTSEDQTDAVDNVQMIPQGEEILEKVVVSYLRHFLPRLPEEGIQSIKTHLLSESTMAHVASHIGLTEIILCHDYPVEDATHDRVFKALIAALHDSSGSDRTALFVRDFVVTQLAESNVNDFWTMENPVELLNTICSNEGVSQPEPRLVGQCGVNTLLPLYRVAFYVDKKMIGLGPGESIDIAKEMAASDALWRLFGTAEHQLNIRFDQVVDLNAVNIPNVSANDWCEKKVQQRLKMLLITI